MEVQRADVLPVDSWSSAVSILHIIIFIIVFWLLGMCAAS